MEILLWFGLSVAVGIGAAKRYGRDGGAWWMLSMFISPFLGAAFLLAVGPKKRPVSEPVKPPRVPLAADADLESVIASLRT